LPVLLIDNVSEYIYTSDQEFWDLSKDFPNFAPPYPQFWSEHRMPRKIHSTECGDTDIAAIVPNGRIGVLVTAHEPGSFARHELPEGTRWVLHCEIMVDWGSARPAPSNIDGTAGAICLAIDEEGRLLKQPMMASYAPPEAEHVMHGYMTWLHPTFLAMSFLHCKNVRVDEHTVDKPLAKKYRARHGVEPTGYKTLVIEPLKQILRHEGKSDQHGIQKACHICRGHFKDYREGRGLFGKYKMLVWQDAIVRGTRGKAQPREVEIKV
jgi:hypothetical protein